jgi:hypothetical protein
LVQEWELQVQVELLLFVALQVARQVQALMIVQQLMQRVLLAQQLEPLLLVEQQSELLVLTRPVVPHALERQLELLAESSEQLVRLFVLQVPLEQELLVRLAWLAQFFVQLLLVQQLVL